jgi:hypothetical protein
MTGITRGREAAVLWLHDWQTVSWQATSRVGTCGRGKTPTLFDACAAELDVPVARRHDAPMRAALFLPAVHPGIGVHEAATGASLARGAPMFVARSDDSATHPVATHPVATHPVATHPVRWRSASRCADSLCLEVSVLPGGDVALRNSLTPDLVPTVVTPREWRVFVEAVKAGEFDDLIA